MLCHYLNNKPYFQAMCKLLTTRSHRPHSSGYFSSFLPLCTWPVHRVCVCVFMPCRDQWAIFIPGPFVLILPSVFLCHLTVDVDIFNLRMYSSLDIHDSYGYENYDSFDSYASCFKLVIPRNTCLCTRYVFTHCKTLFTTSHRRQTIRHSPC